MNSNRLIDWELVYVGELNDDVCLELGSVVLLDDVKMNKRT